MIHIVLIFRLQKKIYSELLQISKRKNRNIKKNMSISILSCSKIAFLIVCINIHIDTCLYILHICYTASIDFHYYSILLILIINQKRLYL